MPQPPKNGWAGPIKFLSFMLHKSNVWTSYVNIVPYSWSVLFQMGLSFEKVRKKIYDCFLDILRIATAQTKNSFFIYEILDELVDDTPYHGEKFCSFVMPPISNSMVIVFHVIFKR